MKHYVDVSSSNTDVYSIDDKWAIIDNPTFTIIPNRPYRNPLIVAIYCTSGSGKGRINMKIFDLIQNSFMIVLPGQITELIDISDDFRATYIIMTDSFTESLGIGDTFSLHQIVES
ncbi:MAG: hypothetical protein IIW87_08215, partial [Alistipes sp.]|nr:hypothetical protein [Alistipes sp.]